jgi:hypothetical protein
MRPGVFPLELALRAEELPAIGCVPQLQGWGWGSISPQVSGLGRTIPCMSERTMVLTSESLDRIGLEVDMRLTDVWSMLFERGEHALDSEFLGWLLRLAYVTGYWDALSEPERGALCAQLGYPVPKRRAASPCTCND